MAPANRKVNSKREQTQAATPRKKTATAAAPALKAAAKVMTERKAIMMTNQRASRSIY